MELLDAYAAAQAKINKVSIEYETQSDTDCRLAPPFEIRSGQFTHYSRGQVHWDGRRCHLKMSRWGMVEEEIAHFWSWWFDGKRVVNHYGRKHVPEDGGGSITTKDHYGNKIISFSQDACLLGYCMDDNERVDTILRGAEELTVRREKKPANSHECFVISGKAKSGIYTVWLDPSCDYNIVHAEFKRRGGIHYYGGNRTILLKRGITMDYSLDVNRFRQINGAWIPTEATWKYHRTMKEYGNSYYSKQKCKLKRTKVTLSPDFDAMRAFEPKIPDGTEFSKDGVRDLIWRNGDAVPK